MLTRSFLVPLFFLALLLVGIGVHRNYGISWDEKTQYIIGRENVQRIVAGKELSQNQNRRYHGASVEVFLYALPKILRAKNAQEVFFIRHLGGFLIFFLGVVAFYALTKRHFESWKMGLLGAAMLTLSPRIFAHSFFNSRDIPTMAFFILSMLTLLRALERPSASRMVQHALASALLMSVRIVGILMPVLTLMGFLLARDRDSTGNRRTWKLLLLFALLWICFTILFWPLLWDDPIRNFVAALQNMSTKAPGGFYFGRVETGMPWHWIPVWIFISTPIFYSVFFLTGLWRYGKVLRSGWREHVQEALFLLWLFVPTGMIATGFGTIFDDWRHVFFVYPAFLLIALKGVQAVPQVALILGERRQRIMTRTVGGFLALSMLLTARWMIINHPLQNVYFSIPKAWADGNFELDYWGLSYRPALEYILKNDPDPVIPILVTSDPGLSAVNMLTPGQRSRILFVSKGLDAKYIVDNFREKAYKHIFANEIRVRAIAVGGIEVLAIYRNPFWKAQEQIALPQYREKRTNGLLFHFGKDFMKPEDADRASVVGNAMRVYFEVP